VCISRSLQNIWPFRVSKPWCLSGFLCDTHPLLIFLIAIKSDWCGSLFGRRSEVGSIFRNAKNSLSDVVTISKGVGTRQQHPRRRRLLWERLASPSRSGTGRECFLVRLQSGLFCLWSGAIGRHHSKICWPETVASRVCLTQQRRACRAPQACRIQQRTARRCEGALRRRS
jgi:hypothetical protein